MASISKCQVDITEFIENSLSTMESDMRSHRLSVEARLKELHQVWS